MTRRWYQFSLRSFLAFVLGCATAIAAIVKIPHVVVFTLSLVAGILASRAVYRAMRGSRPRLSFVLVLASIVAWAVVYVLSLGPFIALSEVERKVSGRYNVGRLRNAYRPVMLLYSGPFRWYVNEWIAPDAGGPPVTNQGNGRQPLVGTWKGEIGNVWNLRPDGTARWRSSQGKEVYYFEWTLDSKGFAIYQYASKRTASAWFGCATMNYVPTDRWIAVEISATQLRLRDAAGKTFSFTRTQDAELEVAP